MKADPFQIGDVLKDPRRFVVPIYQRTYTWKIKPHLETFFAQIEAKAEDRLRGNIQFPHYMGAVLVIPRGSYSFGRMAILDIVDGQQRLTTFQIFLAAVRDLARALGESQTADLLGPLLLNPDGPSIRERLERYKLYPTAYDRKLYCDLIDLSFDSLRREYRHSFHANGKVRENAELLLRGYDFLRAEADTFINAGEPLERSARLKALSAALLEGFQIIVITLDEDDDAQVIFETLNAGGEPLAAMDLVRNDVFHRAANKGEDVEALMERRWHTFEDSFWKAQGTRGRIKKPRIDFFLSDTLAAETGREILLTDLYARYKGVVKEREFESVDSELETLLKHAPTYRALVEPAGDGALAGLARELELFDVSTAYPLVFLIQASDATDEDKAALYRLIVSYVVRRMVCGLTAKNFNNVFLRIVANLRTTGVSLATGEAAFAALDAVTVRFPTDHEFREAIVTRRQYGNMAQNRLRHILCELERAGLDKFDETTNLREDLTIEHVLPEAWMEHWPLPDGTLVPVDLATGMGESQLFLIRDREALKHTLGNLTLLTSSLNPSLGNLNFAAKRERLRASRLKMNLEIAETTDWTEELIRTRAARLSELAIKIWPGLIDQKLPTISATKMSGGLVREANRPTLHSPGIHVEELWTGLWHVNLGVHVDSTVGRNWDDPRRYGFVSAGQGSKWRNEISRLAVGDQIYAYLNGVGYVGAGEVTSTAMRASIFVPPGFEERLRELPLESDGWFANSDDPDMSEYMVGVKWSRTLNPLDAFPWSPVVRGSVRKIWSADLAARLRVAFGEPDL